MDAAGPVAAESPTWGRELARTRWAHRTPTLQGLSFRFAVRCTDASVGAHIDGLLSSLRSPVPAAHWYSVVVGSSAVEVFLDDVLVARVDDVAQAVEWLCWDINRAVAATTSEHLVFHAGGVQVEERGLLLPGRSGTGKSTLVAHLVRCGMRYLSDEVVALDVSDSSLLGFPKAISIDPDGVGLSSELRDRCLAASPRGDEHREGTERASKLYLSPSHIRSGAVGSSCSLSLVVFPRYEHGASTYLRRLSSGDAVLGLVTNCVNLDRHGAAGLDAIARLVDRCHCFELVMDGLPSASRLLLALLERGAP